MHYLSTYIYLHSLLLCGFVMCISFVHTHVLGYVYTIYGSTPSFCCRGEGCQIQILNTYIIYFYICTKDFPFIYLKFENQSGWYLFSKNIYVIVYFSKCTRYTKSIYTSMTIFCKVNNDECENLLCRLMFFFRS